MSDPMLKAEKTEILPRCWTEAAREITELADFGPKVRPWNWLELDAGEAAFLWELLASFVEHLNRRYSVVLETRVPPCWAEHGAVVEELTTLAFAHWQAFSSEHASITGAQHWHSYSLPTFYERLGRWLKGSRTHCDVGRHPRLEAPASDGERHWRARTAAIAAADVALRRQAGRPGARVAMRVAFVEQREP